MAMLPQVFDPRSVEPSKGAPSGNLPVSSKDGHVVVIARSEIKQTQDKNGTFVEFTLRIVDGPEAGAEGPYRLNIGNDNPQTVQIAWRQMSGLCHVLQNADGSIGHLQAVQDMDVLNNKKFRVIVDFQKSKEAHEKGYTEVKEVRDVYGNLAGESKSPVQQAPQQWPAQPMQSPPAQFAPQQTFQPQQPIPVQSGVPWGQR